jgi:hypothetical protein
MQLLVKSQQNLIVESLTHILRERFDMKYKSTEQFFDEVQNNDDDQIYEDSTLELIVLFVVLTGVVVVLCSIGSIFVK